MKNHLPAYGTLCSIFYDATEQYAAQDEVAFFASFIAQKDGRTLEAMSGSGRLQIPLLKKGFVVDGVDNSPAMLERCRERCAEYNLQPELYEQSVLELTLPHTYATVIIAVASFQLIVGKEKALQMLQQLHAHMEPGGNLLIDIYMPDSTNDATCTRMAQIDEHVVIQLTSRYEFDVEQKIANAYCTYDLVIDGTTQVQEHELIQLAWYTDAELTQLLQDAGFEVVHFYDNPFGTAGTTRVVQVRKK